jgi:hypothetical protein
VSVFDSFSSSILFPSFYEIFYFLDLLISDISIGGGGGGAVGILF